jgi:hypothetical protein
VRKINEIAPSPPPSAGGGSCGNTSPDPRAGMVWARMADMWGDRFTREFGAVPNHTWAQAIGRLTDRQISRALVNLANDGLQHPPTLPQFVAAAKRLEPVRFLGTPAAPMIERQPADEQTRAEAVRRLREAAR